VQGFVVLGSLRLKLTVDKCAIDKKINPKKSRVL